MGREVNKLIAALHIGGEPEGDQKQDHQAHKQPEQPEHALAYVGGEFLRRRGGFFGVRLLAFLEFPDGGDLLQNARGIGDVSQHAQRG